MASVAGCNTVSVYTHNMLSDVWVQFSNDGGRAYYPGIAPELLDAEARRKLSIAAVLSAAPDVVCLQEIALSDVAALAAHKDLTEMYRFTSLVENPDSVAREPNGVLVLLRRATTDASFSVRALHFPETAERSGFAIGVVRCTHTSSRQGLLVVNSHIDYGPKGGLRILSAVLDQLAPAVREDNCQTFWCGDFNQRPESEEMQFLQSLGFRDVLGFDSAQHTSAGMQQGGPVRIDYILYLASWQQVGRRLATLEASSGGSNGQAAVGTGCSDAEPMVSEETHCGIEVVSAEVWGLPAGEPVGCEMLLQSVGSDHAPIRATLLLRL